jgi:hypothetical protein
LLTAQLAAFGEICLAISREYQDSPMDFLDDLILQWQICQQGAQTASLEQRVANLERQLEILHQVVLAFAKELRPDLLQQLQAAAHPAKPTDFIKPATGWRVSRLDQATGLEVSTPPDYVTEEEAKAEARRLVAEDAEAKVYVTGWQGRRYRVLP